MQTKPLKYSTPEDLQAACDKYFETAKEGEMTVTGLALVVGSRQLIQDYEKREGYGDIIKAAKLRIENDYELSLRRNGKAGDIFGLKNFGWSDKQELDVKAALAVEGIKITLVGAKK